MTNTTDENSLLGYSNTLKYYSDYHLKEYNQLSNNTDTLKDNIINNGAIAVYYYSIESCYSKDMISYCDDKDSSLGTSDQPHIVAIVGWDDNYSRDKFDGSVNLRRTVLGFAKTVGVLTIRTMATSGFLMNVQEHSSINLLCKTTQPMTMSIS